MVFRFGCVLWLAAVAVGANPPAVATHPVSANHPNIVLITIDTTRADRMGFLGSQRGLTPNMDALAKQAAVFTHAYAQAPLTSPSHASILTGTYPQYHHVLDFPMPLGKDLPYAPSILHANGYRTAAFVASLALDPNGGAPGFDRGFDTYDAGYSSKDYPRKDRYHSVERRGGEVVAHAVAWLNRHPKAPFFLWVHLFDAHEPYDPPEPFKTHYTSEPYDGEVAYMDSAVGTLLQQLKALGVYDGALIALMADHGESLGAHGEDTHGFFLYDETIQVPLVIKLPHASDQTRVENRVELVDVMPTLLEESGIDVPKQVQGESLRALIKSKSGDSGPDVEKWRDRPAFSQADFAHQTFGWSVLQSFRTGKYLYVQAPRRELYDEDTDPKAEHNLAESSAAVTDTIAGQLEMFRQKTTGTSPGQQLSAEKTALLDPAAQTKLTALGYIASGGNTVSKPGNVRREVDPKDGIQTANAIRRVNSLVADENFDAAVPLLQDLIAKNPDMPMLYRDLAGTYMSQGNYEKAVPLLRKTVELDPDSAATHVNLAKGLMGAGDFAGAIPELESVIAKTPDYVEAHVLLEVAYARTHQGPETIRECRKVLEFLPEHFQSHLILGRFLATAGDLNSAMAELKKAAALKPDAPGPHTTLADIYDRLGRKMDAERERSEGQRLAKKAESE